MKCHVYANGELIGWAELIYTDPPMGCVHGPFYPNDNYKKIPPVIREHHLYDGTLGGIDHKRLMELDAKIHAMRLVAVTEEGEILEPVGGVHFVDFSAELDEQPYRLDILGLSHDVFDRLFPTARQAYIDHFSTKSIS